MVKYIAAVSGGVDSVVLLDMLVKGQLSTDNSQLVVAHFDHGIREESAADSQFVEELAARYGLPFETRREELGPNASEERARERRYAFLRDVATKCGATIVTAHHADDVIETIAINLTRGTGWRGLAVLDSLDIWRPLLDKTKEELTDYAKQHDLAWREDATNQDTKYLRNDLRQRLEQLDEPTRRMLRLYRDRQVALRGEVDREVAPLVTPPPYRRHEFIVMNELAAQELLRAVLVVETGASPTRPQLTRALHAIKVLHAGKVFRVGDGVSLRFTKTHFVVETEGKVIS